MLMVVAGAVVTGGGTDYGGCAGRQIFCSASGNASSTVQYPQSSTWGVPTDAEAYHTPNQHRDPSGNLTYQFYNTVANSWGILGGINKSTTFAQIRDGTSNTIMTGEMQRIVTIASSANPCSASAGPVYSRDGWAIGGQASTFSTGVAYQGYVTVPAPLATQSPLLVCDGGGAPADEQRLFLLARQ